jgi:hypothetical protein
MSKTVPTKSITPPAIQARKGGQPIVCLTAYTAATAAGTPHFPYRPIPDSQARQLGYGIRSLTAAARRGAIHSEASAVTMRRTLRAPLTHVDQGGDSPLHGPA